MELTAFSVASLVPRMRAALRNTTAYDAAYLAVADALDVPLLTLDGKRAVVPGSDADVRVIA